MLVPRYMVDEASFHGDLWRNTSRQIKARLPRVQVVVCGNPAFAAVAGGQPGNSIIPGAPLQPSNFSQLEEGGAYEFVDLFIPRMATFVNTSVEVLERIRASKSPVGIHRRVGWYTSGDPGGYNSLNTMMEFSALRARLMLGAAAWKLRPDAYLYYAISGWAAYSQGARWDWRDVSSTLNVQYIRFV